MLSGSGKVGTVEVGRVALLRRYPVKSLSGEDRDALDVDARGVVADRLWAVRDPDGKLGSGKSSRRFRRMDGLLDLAATYDGEVPVVALPDGRAVRGDDPAVHRVLSEHVGREVRLAREDDVPHFDDGPVHLVTTSALAAVSAAHGSPVDVRHFRPNVLLDTGADAGFPEDGWLGRRLVVGEVELEVVAPMPRCVMVTMPQVGVAGERDLLHTVTDLHDTDFGVLAEVRRPGRVALGDPAHLA
jgi:uncharacterized protein YcbX